MQCSKILQIPQKMLPECFSAAAVSLVPKCVDKSSGFFSANKRELLTVASPQYPSPISTSFGPVYIRVLQMTVESFRCILIKYSCKSNTEIFLLWDYTFTLGNKQTKGLILRTVFLLTKLAHELPYIQKVLIPQKVFIHFQHILVSKSII